jgi:hypothetical protein
VSTIKVDDWLKDKLIRLQSVTQMDEKTPSYNEIVKNAIKAQALTPILMRYIYARLGDWNPYDVLSWFYEEQRATIDEELVEAYARLIVETGSPLRGD